MLEGQGHRLPGEQLSPHHGHPHAPRNLRIPPPAPGSCRGCLSLRPTGRGAEPRLPAEPKPRALRQLNSAFLFPAALPPFPAPAERETSPGRARSFSSCLAPPHPAGAGGSPGAAFGTRDILVVVGTAGLTSPAPPQCYQHPNTPSTPPVLSTP